MTWDALILSLRLPSCCSVDVMKGALGLERYGFSSTVRTAKSDEAKRSASPLAVGSSSTTNVLTLRSAVLVEVASRRDPLSVERDEGAGEAGIGRECRVDVPIAGGDKAHPLPLPFDDEPRRRLCTRPADSPAFTFFQRTGDTSYP